MTDEPVHAVVAAPITAVAWEPFGWLPRADTDPADGTDTLHFEGADAHLNTIEHRTDEVEAAPDGLRCAVMYRHETHTQALMSLDAVAVVLDVGEAHGRIDGAECGRRVESPPEELIQTRHLLHGAGHDVGVANPEHRHVRLLPKPATDPV